MKTQIIKIIPCLLAGFILSACVGAVNISGGNTDGDTTKGVIDNTHIKVDDDIPIVEEIDEVIDDISDEIVKKTPAVSKPVIVVPVDHDKLNDRITKGIMPKSDTHIKVFHTFYFDYTDDYQDNVDSVKIRNSLPDGVYEYNHNEFRVGYPSTRIDNVLTTQIHGDIYVRPLLDNKTSASYDGHVSQIVKDGNGGIDDKVFDVSFIVKFGDRNKIILATQPRNPIHFSGFFDSKGVITGEININRNDGILNGYIGQDVLFGSYTPINGGNTVGNFNARRR